MKRADILTKIRGMLALAADASNENEAAAAAAMAQRFLLKHNLCISDVETVTEEDTKIIGEDCQANIGRLAPWKIHLMHATAKAFGCSTLVYSGHRRRRVTVIGTAEDVAVANATIQYLLATVDRLTKANAYGYGRRYVNSYRSGCADAITSKLRQRAREQREEIAKEATEAGTALVLVKGQALKAHMAQYGDFRQRATSVDHSGYDHGRSDGRNVSLNQQLDSDARRIN
jgi:hypothetical protein